MTRFKLPVEQVWCSVFEDDDEALAIWRDEVLPVSVMSFVGFIGLIINCWRERAVLSSILAIVLVGVFCCEVGHIIIVFQ